MPDSPCTGSSSTAAVRSSTALPSASPSPRGTTSKPGTSGANGACLASWGVAERAPIVRPWKSSSITTKPPPRAPPAGELEAHSIASVPELQEHAAAERAVRQAPCEPHPGLGVEEVAHVHEPPGLLADRGDDGRVAVAQLRDGDAAQEVEVLVALVVPEPCALAAHELDRVARVGGHHGLALECLKLG